MAKIGGLGSGLEALFGEELEEQKNIDVAISRVEPRKGQPRSEFDEDALQELAESIKQYGLLQPITVRKIEDGYYQIIAGERRWRAARMAGLKEVPIHIIEADDRRVAELALVENLQREDLNPIEEAMGYKQLMDDYGLTQEQAAQAVGKSRPAVANSLRLLNLGKEVIEMVSKGEISAGHARALIPLDNEENQINAAIDIMKKRLSVRQTEQMVHRLSTQKEKKKEPLEQEVDYCREMEQQLENALGRKVKLVRSGSKGKIEIAFYNPDDREELLQELLLFARSRNK